MAIELNELRDFQRFVDEEVESGSCASVDEAVAKYERSREELARFRSETQPAIEQSERGEARPLDAEALERTVTESLMARGIRA